MITAAFYEDHLSHAKTLHAYSERLRLEADKPNLFPEAKKFYPLAEKLAARFPVGPYDCREKPQKIEPAPDDRRKLLADKHDWEPWEIGPKITLDQCRTGVIVVQ